MKKTHSALLALLAILTTPAFAVTVPATEDAYSSINGKISATTGKATTLTISSTQKAYVKFDLASLPVGVGASLVSGARLRLYVASVKPIGSPIEIREVTGAWQEDPFAATLEPTFDPTVLSTQIVLKAKRFIYVDVTDVVIAWLTDPTTNQGLVISSSGGAIKLGSKEGSGVGYPAELEIDVNFAASLYVGGDPASAKIDGSLLSSNLTLGGTTMGTFSGSGAALTSLAAANVTGQLTSSQLASGLTLGGTTAGTFSGNGAALTNLTAANLSGQLASSQLASSLTLSGITSGMFSGAFAGNGSALTSLTAGNIAGQLTSSQLGSGLTLGGITTGMFSGAFSGNGSFLTNLTAGNVAGQLDSSQLASNLTLGGTTSGTFSGNGSALTNLPAANLTGQITGTQLANGAVSPLKTAPDSAVYHEEAATATTPSPSVAGWQSRNLNGGAPFPASGGSITRSGNTIILQPGTYYISAQAHAYGCNWNQLILRDVTTSSSGSPTAAQAVVRGICGYAATGYPVSFSASLNGIITVSGSAKNFELWHYADLASPSGFGTPSPGTASYGTGVLPRYCEIAIIRLQ